MSMFPVEYVPRLYGGSVQIRSTLASGRRPRRSRLSPRQTVELAARSKSAVAAGVSITPESYLSIPRSTTRFRSGGDNEQRRVAGPAVGTHRDRGLSGPRLPLQSLLEPLDL